MVRSLAAIESGKKLHSFNTPISFLEGCSVLRMDRLAPGRYDAVRFPCWRSRRIVRDCGAASERAVMSAAAERQWPLSSLRLRRHSESERMLPG
jgi:hypothetical protein